MTPRPIQDLSASLGLAPERIRPYGHDVAKVSPAVRRGQLILYHAWENYQFENGKGFQNLMPAPLNPVELAGGQFHLRPMVIAMQPNCTDRDTRVEVERA